MLPDEVRRELRYIEMYTAKRIRNLRIGAYTSRVSATRVRFHASTGRTCPATTCAGSTGT